MPPDLSRICLVVAHALNQFVNESYGKSAVRIAVENTFREKTTRITSANA
jgi:hypothetical protein